MSDIETWLEIVHPEIIVEFESAKRLDPDFEKLPPSPTYVGTRQQVDRIIAESGLKFEIRPWNQEYPLDLGYYYKGELVFKYCITCIEYGRKPRITYWDDYRIHPNSKKEGCCFDKDDCHETCDINRIVGAVKYLVKQIKAMDKAGNPDD